MKTSSITWHDWIEALDYCGSSSDPIIHKGEEMSAADLAYLYPMEEIGRTRLIYWSSRGGKLRRISRGTAAGMLRDRRRDWAQLFELSKCPHCGK